MFGWKAPRGQRATSKKVEDDSCEGGLGGKESPPLSVSLPWLLYTDCACTQKFQRLHEHRRDPVRSLSGPPLPSCHPADVYEPMRGAGGAGQGPARSHVCSNEGNHKRVTWQPDEMG